MTEPSLPLPRRDFSRRSMLLGSLVGAVAAGAALGGGLNRPALGTVPAAGGLIDPALAGVHPRLILGTRVSLTELARRAAAPAYAPFVNSLISYANGRAALPTITGNGDDGQWQTVYWTLPELAMAYLITGNSTYSTKLRNWTLYVCDPATRPQWGGENGGSMGAAAGLIGVSVAYDWCYDLFSPAERATIRDKLALQADRLIEQFGNTSVATDAYWKNDPQPNHRHFRVDGITAAAAAIHGDGASDTGESDDYRLEFARSQLRHVLTWISPDGSQHESITYANYGNEHIVRAVDIFDGIGGGDLWAEPELPGMASFKVDMSLPGYPAQFWYGDTDGSQYYFNPFLWRIAGKYGDEQVQDFLHRLYTSGSAGATSFFYNAWNLLWFDDSLAATGLDDRPTTRLYSDLGIVASRSGWASTDVSLHVKAGVMGGRRLNQWRDRLGPNATYINVGHDHPDGGHFSMSFGGAVFGSYAPYGAYLTKQTNAIVAGSDVGQAGERGTGFMQPYTDMRDRASIPAVCSLGDDTIIAADVTGLYAAPSTSGITRARRTIAFLDRQTAVIVDDVTAGTAKDIHSLFHSKGTVTDVTGGSDIAQTIGSSTVTARYLQSSPDSGATYSHAADTLAVLGTTWRSTVPSATAAHFAAALVPQRSAADAATLTSATATGQLSADLTRPGRIDTVAVATTTDGRGSLSTPGAQADARALVVRRASSSADPSVLTVVDAASAVVAGVSVAVQGGRRNLRLEVETSDIRISLVGVLPDDLPGADLVVGQLTPGAIDVTVDGTVRHLTVGGDGKVTVTLTPADRHEVLVPRP